MSRALLQQAHAALDTCESMTGYYHDERAVSAAMVVITEALAQPEPKPIAWMNPDEGFSRNAFIWHEDDRHPKYSDPVYLAAPPAPDADPTLPNSTELDRLRHELADVMEQRDQAESVLATFRLDAQRYRFMRDLSATGQTPDEFTAAIDAAIATGGQP